jgi:hypothetical protein
MSFLRNLFSKESPDENEILNYAVGKIRLPVKSADTIKEFLQRRYPKSSQEEINRLAAKCSEIFKFCINVPANDETYDERVSNQYPFLSKRTIGSLRGKAFFMQER